MQKEPLVKLLNYILPSEFSEYFDLVDVTEEDRGSELLLHLYLDEKDIQPDGHADLSPNGFYPESCINDFPIRDHRIVLHVRRRRWKDGHGNSYSKNWELAAEVHAHQGTENLAVLVAVQLTTHPNVESITEESMESNCSMIENMPPKGVSFLDLIYIFAMSIVGFSFLFLQH